MWCKFGATCGYLPPRVQSLPENQECKKKKMQLRGRKGKSWQSRLTLWIQTYLDRTVQVTEAVKLSPFCLFFFILLKSYWVGFLPPATERILCDNAHSCQREQHMTRPRARSMAYERMPSWLKLGEQVESGDHLSTKVERAQRAWVEIRKRGGVQLWIKRLEVPKAKASSFLP